MGNKVEEYIRKYTRSCSNELVFKETYPSLTDGVPLYESWLTPDHAREVAMIAIEEVVEKATEWVEETLMAHLPYQIADELIADFKIKNEQTLKIMEKKEQKPKLNVTKEDLIPYIILQGQAIHKQINEAKKKYGSMYNDKNKVSEAFRKFGDPVICSRQYADEYDKITEKRSDLPASVRYVVRDICERALGQCIYDKMREALKEETKEDKSKKNKKDGKTKEH